MRKILLSTLMIAVLALIVSSGTIAFFRDQEASVGNTYTAGTIDIAVNGENSWTGNFSWEDIKPGRCYQAELNIKNVGENPLKLWQVVKCLEGEENGIIEPEQEWYDANPALAPKNDLDTAITYGLNIGGYMALNQEAGITLDRIKDNFIGLLPLDPGANPPKTARLAPGASISAVHSFCLKADTGNWAQSDRITFVFELLAQQDDLAEPLPQLAFLDNKYSSNTWAPTADATIGLLKYEYQGPAFAYDFLGQGLVAAKEYCLIYYADGWPGNHPGALIAKGTADSAGALPLVGAKALGFDLPAPADGNYPDGAKVWLVPCNQYNESINGVIGWAPNNDDWLFDSWPGLINYREGERPDFQHQCEYDGEEGNDAGQDNGNDQNSPANLSAYLDELGADIASQYGYWHDYSATAASNTYISYDNPQSGKFAGVMSASGLKPYATYQVKFQGVPECLDPVGGDDQANEYIGYKGRWTCVSGATCTGGAAERNRTDAQYLARSPYQGDGSECIVSYLVLDYFTADASGNIEAADTDIYGGTSAHVLWCDSDNGDCNLDNSNQYLGFLDPGRPDVKFCPAAKVNLEPEAPASRGGCGGLVLDAGEYKLKIALTEESFHQGNWATVLMGDIEFRVE